MIRNRHTYIVGVFLAVLVYSFSVHSTTTAVTSLNAESLCSCNCDDTYALLNAPITATNLIKWSNKATLSAFTYGFGNYKAALNKASHYFTPQGWAEFKRALYKSGNLDIVKSNKLIVSSQARAKPRIIKNTLNTSGEETWEIQFPIQVTYQNALHTLKQNILITMQISKAPDANTLQGVGITQFIAEPEALSEVGIG